ASLLMQALHQLIFAGRPFFEQDAVIDCVAHKAIWQDRVVAQAPLPLRADAFKRLLRAQIASINAKLHPKTLQGFKAMSEQQIFARSVDAGAPLVRRQPRLANLYLAMCPHNAVNLRAADDALPLALDDHEW